MYIPIPFWSVEASIQDIELAKFAYCCSLYSRDIQAYQCQYAPVIGLSCRRAEVDRKIDWQVQDINR